MEVHSTAVSHAMTSSSLLCLSGVCLTSAVSDAATSWLLLCHISSFLICALPFAALLLLRVSELFHSTSDTLTPGLHINKIPYRWGRSYHTSYATGSRLPQEIHVVVLARLFCLPLVNHVGEDYARPWPVHWLPMNSAWPATASITRSHTLLSSPVA